MSYTILAPGFAKWWGSDARALAQALRREGHAVLDIDEEDYLSWRWEGLVPKILRRVAGRIWIDDYNKAVASRVATSIFDFVLCFKGNLLRPGTVRLLRSTGKPVYNFYPDVSFADHGPNIPASLQYYDCVFTTKSYHGPREMARFGIRELKHVRHGFDPEVHRPLTLSAEQLAAYGCDVSFVGCWSSEKEERLLHILRSAPKLLVKVYGIGWKRASSELQNRLGNNLRPPAFGDELAIVYCASKINLGLLSCSTSDATLRDQTTARTFQIPATSSFMLHEDTEEVRRYFADGEEVMLFRNNQELVEKIRVALESPTLRERIKRRGYERCCRDGYDYTSAARAITEHFSLATNRSELKAPEMDLSQEAVLLTRSVQ